jgi:16S rRNA C967 or C1407 C5-methylase (RsmB/RsmF family)
MSKKIDITERFQLFYKEFYKTRWPDLHRALLAPKSYVAMMNPFTDETFRHEYLQNNAWKKVEQFIDCYHLDSPVDIPFCPVSKLKLFYPLDLASLYPVQRLLDMTHKGMNSIEIKIGDLCSAPGGKALYFLFHAPDKVRYVANELSAPRRKRLQDNFKSYLPSAQLDNIEITSFDAKSWCTRDLEIFDFILLDAPCSSERHYLQTPSMMKEWTPTRSKRLAQEQFSLLCSGLILLRPGGQLIYSTCSISPLENDEIINKLLSKRQTEIKLVGITGDTSALELGTGGATILPDRSPFGPIYFSHIMKL